MFLKETSTATRRAVAVDWRKKWSPSTDKQNKHVKQHRLNPESVEQVLQKNKGTFFKLPVQEVMGWSDYKAAQFIHSSGQVVQRMMLTKQSLSRERLVTGQLLATLSQMENRGCFVGTQTYARVAEILSWTGSTKLAQHVYDKTVTEKVVRNLDFYLAMLQCASRAQTVEAEPFLHQVLLWMQEDKVFFANRPTAPHPDLARREYFVWINLLKFYTRHRNPPKIDSIIEHMNEKGIPLRKQAYACVLQTRRSYPEALSVLHTMIRAKCKPTSLHFRSVFLLCDKVGDVYNAQVFYEALLDGSWYGIVLSSEGEENTVHPKILETPDLTAMSAYLNVFAKRGMLREMDRVLKVMAAREGFVPTHLVYAIILDGLAEAVKNGIHNGVKERVASTLTQALSDGYISCRRVYLGAMSAYAALGDVPAARALRSQAHAHGVPETRAFLDIFARTFELSGTPPDEGELEPHTHTTLRRTGVVDFEKGDRMGPGVS